MKRRTLQIVAVLVVAQAASVAAYLAIESSREEAARQLGTAPPRPTSGSVDSFVVTAHDGTTRDLVGGDRPVLVHFWATWCEPCVDELPLVLELPDDLGFDVVTVGLDDAWTDVDAFVDADNPRVALANRRIAEQAFAISALPQTVLMSADGTLMLRVNGARDWRDAEFLDAWRN